MECRASYLHVSKLDMFLNWYSYRLVMCLCFKAQLSITLLIQGIINKSVEPRIGHITTYSAPRVCTSSERYSSMGSLIALAKVYVIGRMLIHMPTSYLDVLVAAFLFLLSILA